MTAPRFYNWDDDGSPGRALTGNLQNRLKQILVPCLVTGYGSKPSAGWTIGHEHANGFSLINADGNVVNFVSGLASMHAYNIAVYLAEAVTDGASAIISGPGLCSGPWRGDGNTNRQVVRLAGPLLDSNIRWGVIADDKSVAVAFSTNDSFGVLAGYYSSVLYFGSLASDLGSFVFLGGLHGSPSTDSGDASRPLSAGTALRSIHSGLNNPAETISAYPFGRLTAAKTQTFQGQPPTSMPLLSSPVYTDSGGCHGVMRGVVYNDYLYQQAGVVSLAALGFTSQLPADCHKIADIDGIQLAFCPNVYGGCFFTNDARFW